MKLSWSDLNERAFVPYSTAAETCVVQSKSGKNFAGVRIECISFPLTISALQCACTICLSEGEIPNKIFVEGIKNELSQLDFWKRELGLEVEVIEQLETIDLEHPFSHTKVNGKKRLVELLDKAVVPESDFPVSALIEGQKHVYEGVNVEFSDWSKGLCAERVALVKAISAGERNFNKISVHTRFGEISSPCGACRQVLAEHLPHKKIEMFHSDGTLSKSLISELLPFSFKSNHLKKE